MADEASSKAVIRRALHFTGLVQGVGFRWRAVHAANAVGAAGWVRNNSDGSVSMEIQGTETQIDRVVSAIARGTYVRIEGLTAKTVPTEDGAYSFTVLEDE